MGRHKRALLLEGRSMLGRAVDACTGRAAVIAVTPELPDDVRDDRVLRTYEDPPFGGPVAGIAAGLSALPPAQPDDEVLLLACDLATPAEVVASLDAAPLGPDGVCLVDEAGYPQYLAARYRRDAVEAATTGQEARNRSVKATMATLALHHVPGPGLSVDLDTPDDAAAAGVQLL